MIKLKSILNIKVLTILIISNYLSIIFAVNDAENNNIVNTKSNVQKLTPKIKISSSKENLKSLDIKPIRSYLRKFVVIQNPNLKKVVFKNKMDFKKPLVPANDLGIDNTSRYIIGFEQDQFSLGGLNSKILVSGLEKDNHLNYMLFKPDFSYYHPNTKEYLGSLMLNIASASIVKRGKISLLNVDNFIDPVATGMLVMPNKNLFLENNLKLTQNISKSEGYILTIVPDLTKAATNSIVIISLGSRENVKVGNVFKILSKSYRLQDPYMHKVQHIYKPKYYKGEVLIYDVFDKLSLGIVIKCYKEIEILDQIIAS